MNQNTPHGWHLEKSVSLSHIITTIMLIVSAIWWATGVDKRVDANTMKNEHQDERFQSFKSDLKSDLDRIDKKLDKIIESSL